MIYPPMIFENLLSSFRPDFVFCFCFCFCFVSFRFVFLIIIFVHLIITFVFPSCRLRGRGASGNVFIEKVQITKSRTVKTKIEWGPIALEINPLLPHSLLSKLDCHGNFNVDVRLTTIFKSLDKF